MIIDNNDKTLKSEYDDRDSDSDVEYPLIDLKTGLKNELIEKTLKDLKKVSRNSKKDIRHRTSEFSHGVMGQNKSVQFALSKAVNYYFSEQEYILEKMKKAQQKTLADLQRIHLDKRQQMRMTYEYHNEENRQAVLKLKAEAKFLQKQEDLEEAMKQKKISINKLIVEQRNLLKEISLKKKKKYRKDLINQNESKNAQIPKENLVESIENNSIIETNIVEDQIEIELPKTRSFLQTKALEATKNLLNPRTVERNMDERIISNTQLFPDIIKKSPEEFIQITNTEIKELEIHNKKNSKIPSIVEEFSDDNEAQSEINKYTKFRSAKEIMKEHKLQKEKELRDILAMPFNAYRRNSAGKIIELDHPPTKKEFKEPSNKDKYKIRKTLGEERNRYQESINKLTKTTENIIQEDIRKKIMFNAPKVDLKKESIYENKRIGPQSWMNAFVSSNIPDDVDPSSTEAIIYCRYIRAPLKTYSHLPNYLIYHTPL